MITALLVLSVTLVVTWALMNGWPQPAPDHYDLQRSLTNGWADELVYEYTQQMKEKAHDLSLAFQRVGVSAQQAQRGLRRYSEAMQKRTDEALGRTH